MFMINLRGLIILSLFLLGDARRSFSTEDSHHDAQQQSRTLTKDFKVLAEGKDALLPTGLKRPLFRKAEKLLPQGGASPRFPSAMMRLGYGYGRQNSLYDSNVLPGERWYEGPGTHYNDGRGDERVDRRPWDRRGMGGYGEYDMGGRRSHGGNMGGYGGSWSLPAPPPVFPPELTFDDIFAQVDPDKKYADKYEALKAALAHQDIYTVKILAGLSTAEVSQIPDLTAGLRRFLEDAISPHRPQPMFDDRLSVRSMY